MKHDELLEKINDEYWVAKPQQSLGYSSPEAWAALRAVVKQAQPMVNKFGQDDPFVAGWNLAMRLIVEGIEKELEKESL